MPDEANISSDRASFPAGPPRWPLDDPEVHEVLRQAAQDGSWGRYHGPHGEALQAALAQSHRVRHALLCCSGTFAVELALRALRVDGGEVILAGYDFPGNFRAVEAVGARPVLVDVEAMGWRLDPAAVGHALSEQTRALIVSHLHGELADMATLCTLARSRGVAVIEDACQACGARMPAGATGGLGDVGVLSFGGSKLLTSGRGGALLTDRPDVHQRAKITCERGNDAFPLSELQAAVLRPQLQRLEERNDQRRRQARRLLEQCRDLVLLASIDWPAGHEPAFYKLAWRFRSEAAPGVDREHVLQALQAEGLAMHAGFRGFHRRSRRRCRISGATTNAQQAAENTIVLHHPLLLQNDAAIDKAAAALHKVERKLHAC